jgi:hypothetical protein
MQLGKSLVGAIIGAVVGIGVLVLINALTQWDKYWLAIPVAICTGLGVRWVATTAGHPSYVRGVLTGVVAILAFLFGQYVVAQVATLRSEQAKPITAQLDDVSAADETEDATDDETDNETDDEASGEEAGETDVADQAAADQTDAADESADTGEAAAANDTEQPAPDAPREPPANMDEGAGQVPAAARPPRAQQWSTIDLVSLCVAALVGYALGRGSDTPARSSARAGSPDDGAPPRPNPAMPPSN